MYIDDDRNHETIKALHCERAIVCHLGYHFLDTKWETMRTPKAREVNVDAIYHCLLARKLHLTEPNSILEHPQRLVQRRHALSRAGRQAAG